MLSAKETVIHLENLRQSHEITRLIKEGTRPTCTIARTAKGYWQAMFQGSTMANGEWIPMPFTPAATAEMVATEIAKRFPSAKITVRL
jgi:hypothetical protein